MAGVLVGRVLIGRPEKWSLMHGEVDEYYFTEVPTGILWRTNHRSQGDDRDVCCLEKFVGRG